MQNQEDRLLISDPKAVQYIYQTSGYNFVKLAERRELSRILAGRGILWADGSFDHDQSRRFFALIMTSARMQVTITEGIERSCFLDFQEV